MNFPYIRHRVDASSAIPTGEIARPEIPVRMIGPHGSVEVTALIDTGADHVFLSVLLAELLGVEIDQSPAESAAGAGGNELKIWPGEVEIEVAESSEVYRWQTPVGFIETGDDLAAAYLGHVGFLEHFKATFDYAEQIVELAIKAGAIPHAASVGDNDG
jgi:predicted aspartyl protease